MGQSSDTWQVLGESFLEDVRSTREQTAVANILNVARTPVEETLCQICRDVLQLEQVGIHDSFFELGGDSLLATRVLSQVREVFRLELPVTTLFETQTIAGMATRIEAALRHDLALPPPIRPVARAGFLPLSFAQERMWFIHQLDPDGVAYHIVMNLRLKGRLDVFALESSWNEIVKRHEALRTIFPAVEGQPVQVVAPVGAFAIPVIDLNDVELEERQTRGVKLAIQESERPFDLATGPLFRVMLFRLDEQDHILHLAMHHIISDAWSMSVLLQEFQSLYNALAAGETPQLQALPLQPVDFAAWQREWLQGEVLETELAYWRKQLRELPVLELPTDRPRPAVQTYRGSQQSLQVSKALFEHLKDLSEREGVTVYMTLMAAFKTLLYRYTGQDDFAVGMSIANRKLLAVEGLVSAFVNTLVLRTNLGGDPTFRQLVARERQVSLDAYAHQDMPFAKLVAELNPERRINQSPLVQVMFNFINLPMRKLELLELEIEPVEHDHGGAQFDLSLMGVLSDSARRLILEYNIDLFDHETITRMLGHFENLLQAICRNPDERISALPLLSDSEQKQLLVEWNATGRAYPEGCLHELFEAQVERTPENVALRWSDATLREREMTYRELNTRANQLAHYLIARGVAPETIVAICLERTPDLTVGLLGILKAGGAYLPLNPAFPQERLGAMLHATQAPIVLTHSNLLGRLPEHSACVICLDHDGTVIGNATTENPVHRTHPENVAYVIYTSGSTGTPKGVIGLHRGAVNALQWMWQTYPFGTDDVCGIRTPLNFVDSVRESFAPLLRGIPSVLLSNAASHDPQTLVEALARYRVTRVALVPSLLRVLLDRSEPLGQAAPELKYLFVGGEALSMELCRKFHEQMPNRVLVNLYGCSEASGDSTYFDLCDIGEREHIPIGRPIANTHAFILDAAGQPVPVGITGELYLGGEGLARGYFYQPQLTAEKFVPNPFAYLPGICLTSPLLYRTGDLASFTRDGHIKYLGRRDQQVKVRGMRVEVDEVEAVLRQQPAVSYAVVIVSEDTSRNHRLVAHVVPKAGLSVSPRELRRFVQARLPEYMVPSLFILQDKFPLTSSGKVDLNALPLPEAVETNSAQDGDVPGDEMERWLTQLWEQLLQVQPIAVSDDFFELGGHSLLAVRLFAEIETFFGYKLPLSVLFRTPTIEGLAEELRGAEWKKYQSPLVAIQPHGSRAPLFYFPPQNWLPSFYPVTQTLGDEQPVYGLLATPHGDHNPFSRIEDEAAFYVEQICALQPDGPYYLAGYSYGGMTALETAQQLRARNKSVAFLGILDTGLHFNDWQGRLGYYRRSLAYLASTNVRESFTLLLNRVRAQRKPTPPNAVNLRNMAELDPTRFRGNDIRGDALRMARYQPLPYPGRIVLFRTCVHDPHRTNDPLKGWGRLARGGIQVYDISGEHGTILQAPHIQDLAEKLRVALLKEQADTVSETLFK